MLSRTIRRNNQIYRPFLSGFISQRSIWNSKILRTDRDIIPGKEQITGEERAELEGKPDLSDINTITGSGTMNDPYIVRSIFSSRIVGEFTGGELQWHYLREGKPYVTLDGGNFYKLQRVPAPDDGLPHDH